MKRLIFLTASLLTVLLVVLAGILLLLTTVSLDIDATPYKERITSMVQEYTGLEVHVDGEVRFRTGPRLGLHVHGLQVTNPAQAQSPPFLVADLAALQVETAALLTGKLQPTRVELERFDLVLERDPDGSPNWQSSAMAWPQSDALAPGLGWLVTDSLTILIRDSRLTYSDQQAESVLEVELTRAEIVPDEQLLRVDLDGSVNDHPVRLTGSTTTLAQLIEAEGSVPINLSGVALGLQVDAKGALANPKTGAGMDATLTVAGDSLAGLRPWVDDALADDGPVQASVALQGADGAYGISGLDIILGERRLQGRVAATFAEDSTVRIRDGELTYSNRQAGMDWQANVASANFMPGDDALRFDLDGSVNGQAVRVEGKTAAFSALKETDSPFPVELSGVVLGLQVDAEGTMASSKTGAGMNATLTVAGDSLAGLRPWVGDTLAGEGPVQASVALQGADGTYDISSLEITLGNRRLEGRGAASFVKDATVQVRDGQLAYTDKQRGIDWRAGIASASFNSGDDALRFDFDGSVNGQAVHLEGKTAALSGLIEAEGPIPIDLSSTLLGLSLDAKGIVANPRTSARVDAKLTVAGKSLAGLRPWVGDKLAGLGPVKARLTVKGGGDAYELAPFELSVGKGRFDGSLTAELSGKRPRIDLELGIAEFDIRPWFPKEKGAGGSAGRASGGSGEIFSDTPLPTAWMSAADVAARVRIRNLITPNIKGRSLDIDALLEARRLSVDLAGKAIGDRSVTAKLELDGSAQPVTVTLRVKGEKLMIEPMVAATEARGMITGDLDLSLDVRGSGGSADQLARSLNGELLLLIEQAEADLTHLDRLTPGIRNLFGQLAGPRAKSAPVNCGVAAFEFQGGRTQVRALVDTPDSTTVADGDLDLGAETLEIRVVPDPKGVNLKVSAPVVLYGSLASPDYRVEKGMVLVSLTELATKIAVPQVLLVDAFGDAVAGNPCVKIAAGKAEGADAAPLEVVTKPIGQAVQGAEAVVEGTGKVIEEAGGAVVKGVGGLLKGIGDGAKGLFGGGRGKAEEEQTPPVTPE